MLNKMENISEHYTREIFFRNFGAPSYGCVLYTGCAGNVAVIVVEIGIGVASSNAIGKAMNPPQP